jgi:hypothetical protein
MKIRQWMIAITFLHRIYAQDTSLVDKLTIITTTSPIPSNPGTEMLEKTQQSLLQVAALQACKKIIVFDGVPPQQRYRSLAYELYIQNVEKLVRDNPIFANTKLVINREFKHLANSLREAMQLVDTPYVFVHQHDFILTRPFDAVNLIKSMDENPHLKLIRFNRFTNAPNGWDGPIDHHIEGNYYVPLLRTFGWSDNDHIARIDYYRDFVFPKVTWGGAMEWFLHDPSKIQMDHHSYGTYLYGSMNDSPYIYHLDGKYFH